MSKYSDVFPVKRTEVIEATSTRVVVAVRKKDVSKIRPRGAGWCDAYSLAGRWCFTFKPGGAVYGGAVPVINGDYPGGVFNGEVKKHDTDALFKGVDAAGCVVEFDATAGAVTVYRRYTSATVKVDYDPEKSKTAGLASESVLLPGDVCRAVKLVAPVRLKDDTVPPLNAVVLQNMDGCITAWATDRYRVHMVHTSVPWPWEGRDWVPVPGGLVDVFAAGDGVNVCLLSRGGELVHVLVDNGMTAFIEGNAVQNLINIRGLFPAGTVNETRFNCDVLMPVLRELKGGMKGYLIRFDCDGRVSCGTRDGGMALLAVRNLARFDGFDRVQFDAGYLLEFLRFFDGACPVFGTRGDGMAWGGSGMVDGLRLDALLMPVKCV